MEMTIVHKNMNKSVTIKNPTHIPREGDHIDLGFVPHSKVIKVLWTKFPDFDDIFVLVD